MEGGYSVATNPKVYANKSKFNKSLLTQIDTLVIYEEFKTIYWEGTEAISVNIVARKNVRDLYSRFSNYRFYNNGCFNVFILDRQDSILKKRMFNPKYNGLRGVYYKEGDKIKGDYIGKVADSGMKGVIKKEFKFKGDTLFVIDKKEGWNRIYLKRNIPTELLNHNAGW